MFQFLILTIFVLFGAVELFQWLKGGDVAVADLCFSGGFFGDRV